jgi:hypothetical protein
MERGHSLQIEREDRWHARRRVEKGMDGRRWMEDGRVGARRGEARGAGWGDTSAGRDGWQPSCAAAWRWRSRGGVRCAPFWDDRRRLDAVARNQSKAMRRRLGLVRRMMHWILAGWAGAAPASSRFGAGARHEAPLLTIAPQRSSPYHVHHGWNRDFRV